MWANRTIVLPTLEIEAVDHAFVSKPPYAGCADLSHYYNYSHSEKVLRCAEFNCTKTLVMKEVIDALTRYLK